jgi:hypothetical protein
MGRNGDPGAVLTGKRSGIGRYRRRGATGGEGRRSGSFWEAASPGPGPGTEVGPRPGPRPGSESGSGPSRGREREGPAGAGDALVWRWDRACRDGFGGRRLGERWLGDRATQPRPKCRGRFGMVPGARCPVPGARRLVPGVWCPASGARRLVDRCSVRPGWLVVGPEETVAGC